MGSLSPGDMVTIFAGTLVNVLVVSVLIVVILKFRRRR